MGVLNVVMGSYGGFSGLHQQYKLKFSIEKRKQEYRMSFAGKSFRRRTAVDKYVIMTKGHFSQF